MERVWTGVLGSGVLLLLAAYRTRANPRRIVGAIVGGAAAAVLNVAVDVAAGAAGLWRYPGVPTSYAPLWYYSGALMGVAFLALLVWRVARRWGGVGMAVALGLISVLFPIRDYRVATSTHVIEFAPGLLPLVADGVAAFLVVGLGVIVMRAIAGPVDRDALARHRGHGGTESTER